MATTDGSTSGRTAVLPFALGSDRYCVGADRIASVLGVSAGEAVEAAADPWNAGEISVEGDRVRVVDLGRILSAPIRPTERSPDPRLLVFDVTDDNGAIVGWLVDRVEPVRRVDPSALEATSASARFVRGTVDCGDEPATWLDEVAING